MDKNIFDKWHAEGLLSETSLQKIRNKHYSDLVSVFWELKTLLYLGVLLLSSGLGILVYKNINSIGHTAILSFLILLCAASFYYCYKHNAAFSTKKTLSPNALFDYILLLGCLSFITIIAYIQYQFSFFGDRFGLATFVPMLVLFFSAYYFDNIGILSLAITNLAAWMGITVTPLEILKANDFNNITITLTGLLLGILLIAVSYLTNKKNIKKHFEFTYLNFGIHIFFISCIAAMFNFDNIYILWFILLIATAYYFYNKSLIERSFYLLIVTTLYTYFASSYIVIKLIALLDNVNMFPIYFGLIYFIASGVAVVLFLIRMNKKIKADDSI